VFAYGYDQEPYPLDPGPHLFIDWRYILPGRTGYSTPDGQGIDLFGETLKRKVDIDEIVAHSEGAPGQIRLEVEPAQRIGPVVPNDKPWEYMLGYCSLVPWEGRYRIYYEAVPPNGSATSSLLCLAESSDGRTWEKPELGLVEFEGSKRNNIVYGGPVSGHGFHGSSVFLDPAAPAEQRFKCAYMAQSNKEDFERFMAANPGSVTPIGAQKRYLIRCAASADGLRWKPLDGAILGHMSDTGNVIQYNPVLKRYVAYVRMSFMNRRVIGRSEGESLTTGWPAPEMILWQHPQDDPADDYYTNSACLYPGTRTMHLMIPTIYHRRIDSTTLRLASSLDGRVWNWVSPADVLRPGPKKSWDGGCMFAGAGLCELPGDRVALPYVGSHLPHKFPRLERIGQIGLAVWGKERLVGLRAADEAGKAGEADFVTTPLKPPGQTLHLNFRAESGGWIKVQVDGAGNRGLDDCDPLAGDEPKKLVTWKGQSSLGRPGDADVVLRFRVRAAKLFSFEFR
jgi:hypothetical protein